MRKAKLPLIVSVRNSRLSDPDSFRIEPKGLWYIIYRVCLDAGIPKDLAHAHTLRHTIARSVLERTGNNLPLTAKALNIGSVNTTMIYTQHTEEELEEALDLL